MRVASGLLLALAACSGGGSGRVDAGVLGEQCQPGGSFASLTGRAAVQAILNVDIDAEGLVQAPAKAELLLVMDAVQDGTAVAVDAGLCAILLPEVPLSGQEEPIRLSISEETVASVGTVSGAGVLSSADQTCASFDTDRFTIVIGAILDPQDTATLPQADDQGAFAYCAPTADTTCPLAIGVNCACDQEGDALAGATLGISGVPLVELDQVYATMRTRFALSGEVFSADDIRGTIDATIEQGILGCHLEAGDTCTADQVGTVKTLNPTITQQPGNPSTFRAVRIEETMGCAEVIEQQEDLFPR